MKLVAALVVSILALTSHEQPVRPNLTPVDEAALCLGFSEFREQLLGIINRKDARALLRVVDRNVRLSFGDASGHEEFRRMWLSERPEDDVWSELRHVLELGGRCEQGYIFTAPYVFTDWPRDLEAAYYRAVVATAVPLRDSPREDARIVSFLDFGIVRLTDLDTFQKAFLAVEAPNGKLGFVASGSVRSAIDMRAVFVRKDRVWRMTVWIGGD